MVCKIACRWLKKSESTCHVHHTCCVYFKRNCPVHHWKILIVFHSCSQFYVANLIFSEITCHVRPREEYMARALVTCIIRPSSSCNIVMPIFDSPAQDISIPDVLRNEGTHSLHVHSACITLLSFDSYDSKMALSTSIGEPSFVALAQSIAKSDMS